MSPRKHHRSERGHWLIVTYVNGKIHWCNWVQTWAGVQMSRNAKEKNWPEGYKVRTYVLDIERMMDFAITEAANEIFDLQELFQKEAQP
jgi:hypothetical protein